MVNNKENDIFDNLRYLKSYIEEWKIAASLVGSLYLFIYYIVLFCRAMQRSKISVT